MSPYKQSVAFAAMTKAAFRSILKSPSSVIFTIAFPLIFILGFGFLSNNNEKVLKVGISENILSNVDLHKQINKINSIEFVPTQENNFSESLKKNNLDAILDYKKDNGEPELVIQYNNYNQDKILLLKDLLTASMLKEQKNIDVNTFNNVAIKEIVSNNKKNTSIDFILPGQLGFSLLAASIFGTAFVFFSLRQSLVLKRFFATPIKKLYILLAEANARMIFQIIGAFILIIIGKYFFNFTLSNGWISIIEMLILCCFGVMIFMSFGFIISGIAKSESTIPPLANIIALPQFLLADTFFTSSSLPAWIQPLVKIMPLTHLNNALRAIAFDGKHLGNLYMEIGILLIWGIIGYAIAAKTFRWE